MAWNKVTKDELKEAGLDVDAFTAAMTKVGEIDGLKTTLQTVKESVDGLAAIKETLTGLENKLKEFKPPTSTGNNSNSNSNTGGGGEGANGENKEENLDWILEPQKATETVIGRMLAPVITSTADMRAHLHVQNFKNTNPKGFKRYEAEIMEMYNKEPLANRQHPALIQNCYKIVIANHLDDIQKGGETFFVEAGGGNGSTQAGNNTGNEGKKAEDILNKDQLELCAKWGVSPEDYLKELRATGVAV